MSVKKGRVALAVTGSIAAFKAAEIASQLVQTDLDVCVILTAGASRFITALTFEGLTGNPVARGLWEETSDHGRMEHLELARWAELLAVAPASADAIARLAAGRADDVLGATALAFRGPLLIAPAMETNMFAHPATQANLDVLRQRGATLVGPTSGRLASGESGTGRMSEPDDIVRSILEELEDNHSLDGRRVLVTAGPTYEPIDPVRFIGNRSSGKMGYAIAAEARRRGAEVLLVSGPTALDAPPGIHRISVETAREMQDAVLAAAGRQHVIVMCAAVADYTPTTVSDQKLRRGDVTRIEVRSTDDISSAAVRAAPAAIHVGFALETGDMVSVARDKLRRKGQALVVANQIRADHNPFGSDSNEVVFVTEEYDRALPAASKGDVARQLWDEIGRLLTST